MTVSTDLEPMTSTALAPITPPDTDSWVEVVGQVAKLAAHIADTDFVPKGLRGSSAAVTAAILYGREIGLPPMTALTQVHVVEGRPGLYAEAMRALVLSAGHEFEVVEATGAIATVRGRRRGAGRWQPVTWTLDMARAAGLLPANPKSGWSKYPRAMLVARATAELARQLFPDVIHGFRALEESDDTPTDTDDTPAAIAAPTTTVRRAPRAPRKAATPPVDLPATPTADRPTGPPPLPGEDGYIEAPTAGETPPPGTPAPVVGPTSTGGDVATTPPPAETPTSAEAGAVGSRGLVRPDAVAGDVPRPPGNGGPTPETSGAERVTSAPEPAPADDVVEAEIVEDPEVVEVVEPDPEPRARGIDVTAVRLTFEKKLGVTDRDSRLAYISAIVGREINTSTMMTRREASTVLGTLDYCATVEDLDAAVSAALDHRAAAAEGETP